MIGPTYISPPDPSLSHSTPWDRAVFAYQERSTLWRTIGLVVLVLLLFGGARCYGDARAAEAVKLAEANHTDSARVAIAQAVRRVEDSAVKRITAANARADSAQSVARLAIDQANSATAFAQIAQQRAISIAPAVLARTDPQVLAALEGYRLALDTTTKALAATVKALTAANVAIDSLRMANAIETRVAAGWRSAYDSTAKEVAQLREIKNPRCGFGCWSQRVLVVGVALGGGYLAGQHRQVVTPGTDRPARIPFR